MQTQGTQRRFLCTESVLGLGLGSCILNLRTHTVWGLDWGWCDFYGCSSEQAVLPFLLK